jgi:hypothetical protein
MPQIKYSNIDVGACPVENAIASSLKTCPKGVDTPEAFPQRVVNTLQD